MRKNRIFDLDGFVQELAPESRLVIVLSALMGGRSCSERESNTMIFYRIKVA